MLFNHFVKFKCFFLFLSLISFQHLNASGENQTPRYLAPSGVDVNDCSDRNKPCASVQYVLMQTAKNDPVYMAGGSYDIEPEEVVHFTGDSVPLIPGYSTRDLYNTKSTKLNPVTLIGVHHYFRKELNAKGFKIQADTKSQSKEAKDFTESFINSSRKNNSATPCTAGMAGNFPCFNIDLQSQISLNNFSSAPTSASDIWGHVDLNDDREYAIIGLRNGTAIVDVTDSENPSEVGTITGVSSTWRDIKVYQYLDGTEYKAYAYVTTEGVQGLQIIDLNTLPNSVSLANTITSDFSTAHNVYISNVDYSSNTALPGVTPYLYIAGSDNSGGAYRVYDIASNPTNPSLVTSPPDGTGYVHDATSVVISDSRTTQCAGAPSTCEVYIDFNESTVDLWDHTNKSTPTLLSSTPYSGSQYTHSGWYSDNKQFIYVHDELDEQRNDITTRVIVLDISDLTAPQVVNEYFGPTRAIDHNGYTLGDKYYMSNYRRGLTVLDISTPDSPSEFGFFDTFPSPADNTSSFDGAWGTYPYLPSGSLLVSDKNNGLFVLKESANPLAQIGYLGFSETNTSADEDVGTVTLRVERTEGSNGEISVDYATSDTSATAGEDYVATSGTLTWADGDQSEKTITIEIIDDAIEENNENFSVLLGNPSNGANLNLKLAHRIDISANDQNTTTTPPPTNNNSGSGGGGNTDLLLLLILLLGVKLREYKRSYY